MVLDKKLTYKNLKKKGFIDSDSHSDDHKYLDFFYNGKFICYTKISHGSKGEIDDFLIKQMHKQCKLDKNNFIDLVKCPLSAESYLEILRENGELD